MTRSYSARSKNRAQYLPAGQSGSHLMPYRSPASVRGGNLPPSLPSLTDLDWLDPANPHFTSDRALFSAGQFIGGKAPPGMFDRRPGVTILCDSGGLQYGLNRNPWLGNQSQAWSLNFLEANADEAITLDVPTVAIGRGPPQWNSFSACLAQTVANNAFYHQHRTRSDLRFLSVLQGTTAAESVAWYQAVSAQPFEGWAFAGSLRRNYLHMVTMLLQMIADGLLGPERNRIHVLGVSSLVDAVMLSALQRALREHLNDDLLQITFDTSSPSKMVLAGFAYGHPLLSPTEFKIAMFKPPSGHVHAGSSYRFPIASSRLAEKMTIGDLCVASPSRQHGWDHLGGEMVVHHNVEAMFRAIEDANSVLEMPTAAASQMAPGHVVRAYNALRSMFRFTNPLGHLKRHKADFARL